MVLKISRLQALLCMTGITGSTVATNEVDRRSDVEAAPTTANTQVVNDTGGQET